jgi:hypothetical protein
LLQGPPVGFPTPQIMNVGPELRCAKSYRSDAEAYAAKKRSNRALAEAKRERPRPRGVPNEGSRRPESRPIHLQSS